jgi:cell wall-associated NlpC family hydrolase
MTSIVSGARRLLFLVLMALLAGAVLPMPAAASAEPQTELQRLLQVANSEVGSRYAFASTGPNTFDCSGFVFYTYKQAGLLDRIGNKRRTVAGYHKWFRNNGTVSKGVASARPGDVLVWGRDKHTGIYLGDNLAISALVNPYGVKVHRVDRISLKLTAVLQVRLER